MRAWTSDPTPIEYVEGRSPLELQGALQFQYAQCRNCHAIGGVGGRRGPELNGLTVMTGRTAIVVKGYPRLSETFIAQEIRGLEERGLDIEIVSLRHPTDKHTHPVHAEITAPVRYMPEYLYQEPWRVWRAWRGVRKQPAYRDVRRTWLRDLFRDRTPNKRAMTAPPPQAAAVARNVVPKQAAPAQPSSSACLA